MKKKEKELLKKIETAKSQKEAEEILSEHYSQMPIYNVFNFFIGGPNKVNEMKSHVEGKPTQPPY